MSNNEILRTESIGKLLLKFSIPAIVGMMVSALYNVVDRIYIGKIGPLAMTGIGLSLPFMFLLMAFGMLIGIGAGSRISIRLGQNRKEDAEKILGNSLVLLILIMGTVATIGLIFKIPILSLFGASKATIGYADKYLTIILLGAIFQGVGFGLNNIVRAEGSPKIAMYTMLLGAIINIILDPIFIFVFKMGISGAALATILSQLTTSIWVLYHFTYGKSKLKLKKKNLRLDFEIFISIITIGLSPFFIQLAASIVTAISNTALKTNGGDIAISAMTAINAIAIFFLMPIFGINQGSQPIIGYNYGAKEFDRVKKALKYAILAATSISILGFILVEFLSAPLILIFNNDPELISMATRGMRIYLSMLPFIGFQIISANYFQAVGKAGKSIFLSLLRQVIVLIPMLFILPRLLGLTGVWMAGPVSDLTASILTAIFLFIEIKHLDSSALIKKQEELLIASTS
ncbi:MAG: MATE family efflux transporter [Firmicutes bacterium HGW-Firmicutes-1]|jgi:putative MATE family efflux protein|nr:MAG: MATE family efflux transporter [Firmicutes bacterium HGW-Firmicutes-1]